MPHLMILRPAEASRLSALFLWSGHKKTGRCPVFEFSELLGRLLAAA